VVGHGDLAQYVVVSYKYCAFLNRQKRAHGDASTSTWATISFKTLARLGSLVFCKFPLILHLICVKGMLRNNKLPARFFCTFYIVNSLLVVFFSLII
jgi:hypothetical protein